MTQGQNNQHHRYNINNSPRQCKLARQDNNKVAWETPGMTNRQTGKH